VKVYAGIDQLSGEKLWLRETVPARATRREIERETETAKRAINAPASSMMPAVTSLGSWRPAP
jgi:hypothetical protein